jgi:hypothetical protein
MKEFAMLDEFSSFNCTLTGDMFKLAGKKHLNIEKFIDFLFNDDFCSSMLQNNMSFEWCDDAFMLDTILRRYKEVYKSSFPKSKIEYDDYVLWFGGYLYKYWIDYKDLKPDELPSILNKLSWKKYLNGFEFYHTQDWQFIVNEVSNS